MMRFFLILTFGFLCVLIQSNLFLYDYIFPIKPDLTLPLTAYICLFVPPAQGAVLVLLIGYLMDITSGGVLGLYIFLRTLVFLIVYLFKGQLTFENKVFFCGAGVIFFLCEALLASILFQFMGASLGPPQKVLTTAFFQGIFTLAIWLVLFPLLTKFEYMAEKLRGF